MFVGRKRELELLTRELSVYRAEGQSVPLVCLSGEPGSGKSAFLRALGDRLIAADPNSIWIWPRHWEQSSGLDSVPELLCDGMEIGGPEGQALTGRFIREYERGAVHKVSARSGAADPETGGHSNALSGGDSLPRSEAWLEAFDRFLQPHGPDEVTLMPEKKYKVYFVFDDYTDYPQERKSWISEFPLKLLERKRSPHLFNFIVCGDRPIDDEAELKVYWNTTHFEVRRMTLGGLELPEVREFLAQSRLPEDCAGEFLKRTRGNPARLQEAARIALEKGSDYALTWTARLLEGKSDRQKRWIFRAAVLDTISTESLSIFQSRNEAREALNWLKHSSQLNLSFAEEGYRLEHAQADFIVQWLESNDPKHLKGEREKAAAFREICRVIPSARERSILGVLSLFQYFNEPLIRQVFDADEEEILQFIETQHHYFEKTEYNLQIAPAFLKAASFYRRLIPISDEAILRDRILECWQKRCESIRNEIESEDARIDEKERERDSIREELERIHRQIQRQKRYVQEVRSLQPKRRETSTEVRLVPDKKQVRRGQACEIAGIAVLGYGILFPGPASLAYGILGLSVIFYSLFLRYKRARVVPADGQADSAPSVTAAVDVQTTKNIRILNLRATSLDHRLRAAAVTVARHQTNRRHLESMLLEPYGSARSTS